MAKKTDERTARMKTLDKLIKLGYTNEQAISALNTAEIIAIPNVTVTEISIICELQRSIKDKRIIAWLGGEERDELLPKEKTVKA